MYMLIPNTACYCVFGHHLDYDIIMLMQLDY